MGFSYQIHHLFPGVKITMSGVDSEHLNTEEEIPYVKKKRSAGIESLRLETTSKII